MTAINATPDPVTGAPAIQDVWSVGDYDRLASYGSAPEAAHLVRFASVQSGDRVLDVGTGSGLVAIMAAQQGARAIGVDPTPALLAKAKENAALAGCGEIQWHEGAAELLPFADGSFDVVVSNGVIDLIPDKDAVFSELYRVLVAGGRMQIADVTIQNPVSEEGRRKIDLWTG